MLSYKSGIKYIKKVVDGADYESCSVPGFRFSDYTTYGLGGGVSKAYFPRNFPEARKVYDELAMRKNLSRDDKTERACSGDFFIFANGSNVLASDGFFKGEVLCTRRLRGIMRTGKNQLFCAAGTPVSHLLNYCLKYGLGGLEYLYGIPATIGGITYMNGGAGGRYISSNVVSVSLYDGKNFSLSNENCKFGYKYSTMRDINALILGTYLSVSTSSRTETEERLNYYKSLRRGHPKGRSCGCVFKNPEGLSAGKLIQDCNLSGLSVGGAHVSDKHCNFIINDGATAEQVRTLIRIVSDRVFAATGIRLEEEVVYIGDFDDFNG